MRKKEDMTPKKIKKPSSGYVGEAEVYINLVPQAPVVPAYVTIDNIKKVPKPKNEGLLKAVAKKKETTLAQVLKKKAIKKALKSKGRQ
jgi:hypothetical protein